MMPGEEDKGFMCGTFYILCDTCIKNGWTSTFGVGGAGRFEHDGKTNIEELKKEQQEEGFKLFMELMPILSNFEENDVTGEWMGKSIHALEDFAANQMYPYALKNGFIFGDDFLDIRNKVFVRNEHTNKKVKL